MAFHKMASGHFAYVINESGNRQLVTQEQFEDCCCPAPSTCPCSPWPPSEWPCSGLNQTYVLDVYFSAAYYYTTSDCTGTLVGVFFPSQTSEVRLTEPCLLTASTSCKWTGTLKTERRFYDGSTWGSWSPSGSSFVFIDLSASQWDMSIGFATYTKTVGLNPTGTYAQLNVCTDLGGGSVNSVLNIGVS